MDARTATSLPPSSAAALVVEVEFDVTPPVGVDLPAVSDTRHGTRRCYVFDGCRCKRCSAANAEYEAERRAGGPRLVDASEVRAHLVVLSQHMGLRRIEKETGVSRSRLTMIRSGHSRRLRRSTAERILAVEAPR